jgi:hypothetical protein
VCQVILCAKWINTRNVMVPVSRVQKLLWELPAVHWGINCKRVWTREVAHVLLLSRQAVNVWRNLELCSPTHCSGEAISITYSVCMSVTLGIQHAKHMQHIVLPSVTCLAGPYFFHIFSQMARFLPKKKYRTQNVCFDFLYNFCLKHFSF